MSPKLVSVIRVLRLADSEAEFQNKLLNPAFRLSLNLYVLTGVGMLALLIIPNLPDNFLAKPNTALARFLPKKEQAIKRMSAPSSPPTSSAMAAVAPVPEEDIAEPPMPTDLDSLLEDNAPPPTRKAPPETRKREEKKASPAAPSADSQTVPVAETRPAVEVTETPVEADEAPSAPETDGPLLASPASKIFHTKACPRRPAARRHPVYFASAESALSQGFRPCPRCQNAVPAPAMPEATTANRPQPQPATPVARPEAAPATGVTAPPKGALPSGPIIASAKGVYHAAACALRPAPRRNPFYFASVRAAASAGLRPCFRCQKR